MRHWTTCGLLFLALTEAGCGPESDDDRGTAMAPRVETAAMQPRNTGLLPVPASLPGEVADQDGRLWRVKQITQRAPASAEHEQRTRTQVNYALLSDDQIADRMRMVKLIGDLEYTEVYPDVARARLARQRSAAGKTLRADRWDPVTGQEVIPASEKVPSLELGAPASANDGSAGKWKRENPFWLPPSEQSKRTLFFTEDRTWVESIGETFARKVIKHVPGSDFDGNYSGGGSGTLIGARTGMAAAHSFYDQSTGLWLPTKSWVIDTIL